MEPQELPWQEANHLEKTEDQMPKHIKATHTVKIISGSMTLVGPSDMSAAQALLEMMANLADSQN